MDAGLATFGQKGEDGRSGSALMRW